MAQWCLQHRRKILYKYTWRGTWTIMCIKTEKSEKRRKIPVIPQAIFTWHCVRVHFSAHNITMTAWLCIYSTVPCHLWVYICSYPCCNFVCFLSRCATLWRVKIATALHWLSSMPTFSLEPCSHTNSEWGTSPCLWPSSVPWTLTGVFVRRPLWTARLHPTPWDLRRGTTYQRVSRVTG